MTRRQTLLIAGLVALVLIASTTFGLYKAGLIFHALSVPAGKPVILATFYPQYDFTKNIGGDKIDLQLLVPMTMDVHAFEPTPSSVQQVANARVLIYNGAGLEPWVPQIVISSGNRNLLEVNASKGIDLIPIPPEYQREGRVIDPHVWLDPVLAKQQVNNILQALIGIDPGDQAYFTSNAQAYNAKLDYLNSEIANATRTSIIQTDKFVTFHEAFGYFAKRYHLTQVGIAGPFEEEPTSQDIQKVIDTVNQNHLCFIGYESLTNPDIANQVAVHTHAKLIRLDPIEGLSPDDQVHGATYLIKMREDLQAVSLAVTNANC